MNLLHTTYLGISACIIGVYYLLLIARTHVLQKAKIWTFIRKLTQPRIIFTSYTTTRNLVHYTGMWMTLNDHPTVTVSRQGVTSTCTNQGI